MAVTYFGQNSDGNNAVNASANYLISVRFQNTAGTGNITELGINIHSALTGSVRLGVYADGVDAQHPGALLLDAGVLTNPGTGWQTISGLSLAVTENTYYCLAHVASSDVQVRSTTGVEDIYKSFTYATLPNPFGTGTATETNATCLRAGVELTPSIVAPTVTTTAITDILGTSATSGGTVTNTGGEAVTDQGVCWSTSTNPTVADSHTHDVADPSPFVSSLTSLTANTIYHVKAFAANSAGTSYGAEVDFETDVVPTLAATTAISKITHATASSGGNVTADGGATITARGACWNTSTLPTTANSKTTDAGTTGAYTSAITGLSPATTYHLRSYATNSVGTTYGTEVDFTTDTLSDISDAVFTVAETTTPVVSSLSDSTVYSGQVITITGTDFGASQGYVRFIWNYAAITSWAATSIVVTVPPGVVSGNLYVGLPTEVWSAGTAYTLAVVPTLTTAAISAIAATTATGGGAITSDGNATVTAHGICWNTSTAPTTANSKTDDILDPTPFVSSITGLTRATKYYVRSYATNPVGTGYGPEVEFTSASLAPTMAATSAASAITYTTASSGGNVTDDGGATVTARGVCWNTSTAPTTANSKTTDAGTTGAYASSLTGLTRATKYYVRSYATNSIGTTYGAEIDFTTLAIAPTLTTSEVTQITPTTATGGGELSDTGGSDITQKGACWALTANPTTSSSMYEEGPGGIVGTVWASRMDGLDPITLYHVRAYATNAIGTSYGADTEFTTQSAMGAIGGSLSMGISIGI
jgi:hypothetical protein